MNRKKINIDDALKNDENFLQFLAQEAQSDSYRERKKQTEQGPHPTDDMLYDYVLGYLDEREAGIIREHIAFCGLCAQEVLQFRMIEENLEEKLVKQADTLSLKTRIQLLFSGMRKIYLTPGLCAAGICLLIWLIYQPDPLSESYRMISALGLQTKFDESLSLPWEKPAAAFGFTSHRHSPAPANRAFGAGLWAGRAELCRDKSSAMPESLSPKPQDGIKKDHWSKTQWAPFYSAGRWCLLAQAVCMLQENIPYEFWEKQILILNQIQKDFEKLPETVRQEDEILYKTLERVESAIKDARARPCRTVASEIVPLIGYMSPESEK